MIEFFYNFLHKVKTNKLIIASGKWETRSIMRALKCERTRLLDRSFRNYDEEKACPWQDSNF